jgi:hypothetical protein
METKKHSKKIAYIDYACQIGERVYWNNISGQRFEGIITEWKENEVAVVKLDDSSLIEVKC